MDVLPAAIEGSNVMKLGPSAIAVAKEIELASFHHRSNRRSGSTGLQQIRQLHVPQAQHRMATMDIQRVRKRLRTLMNRAPALQMLRTTPLQSTTQNQRTIIHQSSLRFSNQTLVRAQPKTRASHPLLMSGSPSQHRSHLLRRSEVGPFIPLQP